MVEMKSPIIELRENNLFVLMDFEGKFFNGAVKTRHNVRSNKTKYVIDSKGATWHFVFQKTDNMGFRKAINLLWNISSDYYTYSTDTDTTIDKFRTILNPYLAMDNPDFSELASSLIESVSVCDSSDYLKDHIELLNL